MTLPAPRWWTVLLAGALGFVAGAGVAFGWRTPARVERTQETQLRELQERQHFQFIHTGPVTISTKRSWRGPAPATVNPGSGTLPAAPAPCLGQWTEDVEERRGPATARSSEKDAHLTTLATKDVLRIVPAPLPRFGLFLGAQLYPETLPVLGLGMRLVGPVWLEAWARPHLAQPPALGAQLRVTF